jgi:hypothetical protein
VFVYGGLTLWTLTLAGIPRLRAVGIVLRTLWIYLPLVVALAALKWLLNPSGIAAVILSLLGFGGYLVLLSHTDPTLRHFVRKLYSSLWSRLNWKER